ncbi:KAP P-loop [Vibrionales bacterium SWAT-3]|nr:KAP P-loop [Vibrionales bacterium SWAT-3]
MNQQVNLDWSSGRTIGGEWYPEDKLDRAKYAEFLTRFLESEGYDAARGEEDSKRTYVLNLNSTWGSGKTYFLKRWAEDLKATYPVVYVDAWERDYSDDPLMTVISAIIKDLRAIVGKDEDRPEIKYPAKLVGLLKAAAPGLARGVTKRYLGIDLAELSQEKDDSGEPYYLKDEDGKVLEDDKGNPIDLSFAASEAVKHLIEEHEAKSDSIKSLKESVGEWVDAVKGHRGVKYPAFVFIDELDRCRPSYAVEMLETIKHVFDIPGVVFVVATDTEQLQHAVKAIYGEGFNAKVYLGRFFNSRFSLNAPDLSNLLEVHCDLSVFSAESLESRGIDIFPCAPANPEQTIRNLSTMIGAFDLPARTAIQVADRVIATVRNMRHGTKLDILTLTVLLCLKEKDNDVYERLCSGRDIKSPLEGKDNTITLDKYFEETLSKLDMLLYLDLAPNKKCRLIESRHGQKINNVLEEGCYQISIAGYIEGIVCSHLGFSGVERIYNLYSGLSDRTDSLPPLQQAGINLVDYWRGSSRAGDCTSSEALLRWLKYIYIADGYSDISFEKYKELVEFASALDWMDEDEEELL